MIESTFLILLQISAVYAVVGVATAVWFFARRIKQLDPPAAGGSLGFRLSVTPGIIALWPLILLKAVRPHASLGPDRAEELRRNHRVAIVILAVAGVLLFTAAMLWRAPAFQSLPETKTSRP